VQAFTVYEDSISESRAQLQAITLVIGTLAGAKVFGVDNYDTLITKAALHGAKLLKKSHQATAVGLASHLWWQEAPVGEGDVEAKDVEEKLSLNQDGADGVKAVRIIFSHHPCVFNAIITVPTPGQQACAGVSPKITKNC
jgi:vacuolar protein sorting-associated protein 35